MCFYRVEVRVFIFRHTRCGAGEVALRRCMCASMVTSCTRAQYIRDGGLLSCATASTCVNSIKRRTQPWHVDPSCDPCVHTIPSRRLTRSLLPARRFRSSSWDCLTIMPRPRCWGTRPSRRRRPPRARPPGMEVQPANNAHVSLDRLAIPSACTHADFALRMTGPRYHAHHFTGGTPCDLTGSNRSTEVRFVCAPDASGGGSSSGGASRSSGTPDSHAGSPGAGKRPGAGDAGGGQPGVLPPTLGGHFVESIKEPTTCHYVLTLATPALCAHAAFRQDEPTVAHIRCSPLIGDEEQQATSGEAEPASTGHARARRSGDPPGAHRNDDL